MAFRFVFIFASAPHPCTLMKLTPFSVLLFSLFAVASVGAQEEEGFVPMFNGKDLSGWRPVNVASDTFRWENGMVITTGVPTGFMATEKMYENFIVELDWRHMKEGGNSGVFIWGEGLPAPGVPYARGIEVQVLDLGYETQNAKGAWKSFTSHGDIFPIWGATMTPVDPISPGGKRSFPSEKRVKPSPEWNHYRIECNKGEIKLSVNGKQVTVGRDCVPRKGFLCLESEGAECHFKNVRIKELPSSNTPAGTDRAWLRRLQAAAQRQGPQRLEGDGRKQGRLERRTVSTSSPRAACKGSKLDLWTEKNYKDFTLVADWKYRTPAGEEDGQQDRAEWRRTGARRRRQTGADRGGGARG